MTTRVFVLAETVQELAGWCRRSEIKQRSVTWVRDGSVLHGVRGGHLVVLPGARRRPDYDELIVIARCAEMDVLMEAEA